MFLLFTYSIFLRSNIMKNIIQKGTICIEDLEIGMSRMLERQITQNDIATIFGSLR